MAPHRSAWSIIATQAAASSDLLVFGVGGVPTARRSHTMEAGRAPMRPARVSSLRRSTCAQTVDSSAWRSQHPSTESEKLRGESSISTVW